MPELPDLTHYAINLRKLILDTPIETAEIFNARKVSTTADALRAATVGSRITAIDRNGKELFFTLSSGHRFGVHLMLNGKFTYLPYAQIFTVNAKIICLGFADGQALTVSDISHMARVALDPATPTVPDALAEGFSYDYFEKIAHRKATANVKAFLIDQQVVRGIGNAYVDEILWRANISPKSIVGRIPPEYRYQLYEAIRWVLEDGIEQIGRLRPDSISGEERSFLRVHLPRKAQTAQGDPIRVEEIAQKKTYYTDRQLLFI